MGEHIEQQPDDNSPLATTNEYVTLVTLWSGGERDYHSLFSGYLSANAIFVAAGMLVLAQNLTGLLLAGISLIGLIVALQMAVALARLSGQNALFEWRLRSIELVDTNMPFHVFSALWQWREESESVSNPVESVEDFQPNCAVRIHRRFLFRRSQLLPWLFVTVYLVFIGLSVGNLCR